jgi:ribosomal protein L13
VAANLIELSGDKKRPDEQHQVRQAMQEILSRNDSLTADPLAEFTVRQTVKLGAETESYQMLKHVRVVVGVRTPGFQQGRQPARGEFNIIGQMVANSVQVPTVRAQENHLV